MKRIYEAGIIPLGLSYYVSPQRGWALLYSWIITSDVYSTHPRWGIISLTWVRQEWFIDSEFIVELWNTSSITTKRTLLRLGQM